MARALVLCLLVWMAFGPSAAAVPPDTSTSENPSATFATPGTKQVTLTACNGSGCTSRTQTVMVLNPMPVIDQMVVGGLAVTKGQLVSLAGAAHGRPALGYTWKILSLGPEIDLGGTQAWWDTSNAAPGAYVVSLVVQNVDGSATSAPVPVVVAPDAGMGFYTMTPCRVLDTRNSAPLTANGQLLVPVAAGCGVPASAKAVAVNITAVTPSAPGYVAVYPGNYPLPPVSTINFRTGQVRANSSVLGLSSDGTGTLMVAAGLAGTGSVHLLVDVDGYFQ